MNPTQDEHAPSAPAKHDDARSVFARRCIRWARDRAGLHTARQPDGALPWDDAGRSVCQFLGRWETGSPTGSSAYLALVLLFAGWVFWASAGGFLSNLPPAARTALGGLGYASMILGAIGLPAAWLLTWYRRVPVRVIVKCGDDPVPEASLRTWHRESQDGGRRTWVFSRAGFDPAALRFAATAGIRCLVAVEGVFEEAAPDTTVGEPRAVSQPSTPQRDARSR